MPSSVYGGTLKTNAHLVCMGQLGQMSYMGLVDLSISNDAPSQSSGNENLAFIKVAQVLTPAPTSNTPVYEAQYMVKNRPTRLWKK